MLHTDHDIYRLDLNLPAPHVVEDLCIIVRIQPRKRVLDHADYTAPTRQLELDRIE